jgi:four helix bundle protein
MFDFEKLSVYQNIRWHNKIMLPIIFSIQKDYPYLADQLKRASLSVQLNLAEGTGRVSNQDKKRFYIISRSSLFECVAILQSFKDLNAINEDRYNELYESYEIISKNVARHDSQFEVKESTLTLKPQLTQDIGV